MIDKQNVTTRLCESRLLFFSLILLFSHFSISCTPKDAITPKGIKIAHLGKEMPPDGNQYAGYRMRDTAFNEEGFQWPALILETGEGEIWLEGDFEDGKSINRIRVETPELWYKKKIHVGSSLAELQKLGGDWVATYIRKYGKIDIYVKGVHFLVDEAALPLEKRLGKEAAIAVEAVQLNLTAKIDAIVVF